MGLYTFRLPVLICAIAAGARLLLEAPIAFPVGVCAVAALLMGVRIARLRLADRRRRAAVRASGAEPEGWIDCEAELGADGFVWTCHERKGHDGPHAAVTPVRYWRD